LSIPAIFMLGKTVAGKREGLIAAFLLAVSPVAINYSVEARCYALLLLLSILSTYLLLKMFEPDRLQTRSFPPRWLTVAYVATSILVAYTHWFGLLLLCVQAVGLFFYLPMSRAVQQRIAVVILSIMAGCAPLFVLYRSQTRIRQLAGG